MCEHRLGNLPCTNPLPHAGDNDDTGRGCTHDAGTGIPAQDKDR